ncbi:MAG: NAD(P)-binding domain-containing protein, partial [Chlamydiae bacterium]|nr:NAD(P)-binding domain-containing protein [Chlamydiota bacterium]
MEITTLSLRQILKAVWEDTKALVNPATWKSLFTGKDSILEFGERYPVLTRHGESNIHNLFIIGNLSGEPDIKAALNQGVLAARYLYEKCLKGKKKEKDIWPVLIIGGGPAGVAAALELEKQGVDYLVLEKSELFTTVRKFEKDLPLFYAKTGLKHVLSDLEFHDSVTHKILSEWDDWMKEHPIKVKIGEQVKDILKQGGRFAVKAAEGAQYEAQHVILAVGKLVLLNKLQVAEEKGCVTKENVEVTQLPQDMLCRIPLRFERTFGWKTWIWFFSWVSLIGLFYTLKKIHPQFGNFNLGSFYPWLYTGVVWIFGIKAILRYRDSLQTKKYLSPVFFQTTFFSVIPEVILHHWQAYSLLYAWPLGLSPVTVQSFLQSPQKFYFWWTVILSFVL